MKAIIQILQLIGVIIFILVKLLMFLIIVVASIPWILVAAVISWCGNEKKAMGMIGSLDSLVDKLTNWHLDFL